MLTMQAFFGGTSFLCSAKEDDVGEISSPRKSLKIRVKQQKTIFTPIPPSCDDRERDDIIEATLPSLALHKTTKIAEEQENVDAVKEKLLEEDIEKSVEGEDERSCAIESANSVFLNDE
nr:hypothetical protein [Tanacetum cinerariifolium]GEY67369.1 hypothetical protein [Tanacetum cinerariifolium]